MSVLKFPSSGVNDLEMDNYWRFTGDIEDIPEAPGVYAFFDEQGNHILMGSAAKSLRSIFSSHWKGYEGGMTCGAACIAWEQHARPLVREAELVERYERRFGRAARRRAG
jgi:excinuclease UvrABC nuclease subunit